MDAGLGVWRSVWLAWNQDAETDEWRYSLHATRDAAYLEVDDPLALREGGEPCVQPSEILAGTPALTARVKVNLGRSDALAFCLMALVEDNLPQVDGLWWAETHDVWQLSAPRGGIFPQRVPLWAAMAHSERVPA